MPDVSFSAIDGGNVLRNFAASDPGDAILTPYRRTSPDQQAELVTGLGNIVAAIGGLEGTNAIATAAEPTYIENEESPLSVTLEGRLRTESEPAAGATWAVTGTFFQATQPVSGTFWPATQPVSIAGSVAVTGAFYPATQPISAASLPLPVGAATAALQGVQGTGAQYNPPVGGSGEIGYLSGILQKLNDPAATLVSVMSSEMKNLVANTPSQQLGATGAVGDQLDGIWVVPTATTVGAISVANDAVTSVLYSGGTVGADLKGFFLPFFGVKATAATGFRVSVGVGATGVAFGQFT